MPTRDENEYNNRVTPHDMRNISLRIDKVDDAISKLAGVSADIAKMLAVQEQRIIQQEKTADILTDIIERDRTKVETKVDDIYSTIEKKSVEMSLRVTELERKFWMISGGLAVIQIAVPVIMHFIKI